MPRLGNEWRSTSTLSVYLHFVHRQIFIFASYYLWSWFQYIILLLFHSTHCTPWDLTWFGNFYNYALCDFEEFGTSVLKNEIMNSNNLAIESSWNVMALGDARKGKWRGNWRMEWVASTLHTTSEHGVSIVTTANAHNSAANNRLNWRPCQLKWTRSFRGKTKSGFCACTIGFQTRYTLFSKPQRCNIDSSPCHTAWTAGDFQ